MPRFAQVWLYSVAILLACALPASAAEPKKPLRIARAALLEAEDGFSASPETEYHGGETLYMAFHVEGFTVDRSDRVKLSYRIDTLDAGGTPLVEPQSGKVDTELAPEDAKWTPRVRFSATLPEWVESGLCKLVIHVTDDFTGQRASAELPFRVQGRGVPPSDSLAVRNFQFAREENGDPLPAPAYRRGDVLWASFDITGYKTGNNNLVQVQYELSVFNAEGKLIFRQPQPAEEKGTSFYPRRYVHAAFNLNLEKSIAPGEYTIVLTTRDEIGHQTNESRHSFTIE